MSISVHEEMSDEIKIIYKCDMYAYITHWIKTNCIIISEEIIKICWCVMHVRLQTHSLYNHNWQCMICVMHVRLQTQSLQP